MKKLLLTSTLALILALLVSVTGCGNAKRNLSDKWWYYAGDPKYTLLDVYYGADGTYKAAARDGALVDSGSYTLSGTTISVKAKGGGEMELVKVGDHELTLKMLGNDYKYRDSK